MRARVLSFVLVLAAAPFVTAADEENPYKKVKVGDYATYKMTTKVGGMTVEGTLTQTVSAKSDKEATLKVTGNINGVEIPARAGCVKGRRMATVPKCKFDLEVCGGIFVNEPCVVDGNVVSGRTYHDHPHYIPKWMKLLNEERARHGDGTRARAGAKA